MLGVITAAVFLFQFGTPSGHHTDAAEIRFRLLTEKSSYLDHVDSIGLPYEQTNIHFALVQIQKGRISNMICLTEPNSFNRQKEMTSLQVENGSYSIIALPSLTVCRAKHVPEKMIEQLLFAVQNSEIVEISCTVAEVSERTSCYKKIAPKFE